MVGLGTNTDRALRLWRSLGEAPWGVTSAPDLRIEAATTPKQRMSNHQIWSPRTPSRNSALKISVLDLDSQGWLTVKLHGLFPAHQKIEVLRVFLEARSQQRQWEGSPLPLLFQRQRMLSYHAHNTDDNVFIQAPFSILPTQIWRAKSLLLP